MDPITHAKYVDYPGFNTIKDPQLKAQLIDFGITSGPAVAIRKLQAILSVEPTGILDTDTRAALATFHPEEANNLLVAARVTMIGKLVTNNHLQLHLLNGWLARALSFLT